MECNKEEAIRAKGIAEQKMKIKDFTGAWKIALKAQQLYPDLEHITQIIMVCEVHCSAENNVYGNEKDWYGILKIDQTADESSIKKQYRKFALLLHPDKNKYAGATDAFKLIGEAQRVLLDRDKRISFDVKYKASRTSNVPKQPTTQHPFVKKGTSQFPGGIPQGQQRFPGGNVTKQPTTQNPFVKKATSPFPGGFPQAQQPFPGGNPQTQQRFPGGNPQTQQRFPGGNSQTHQQPFTGNPPPPHQSQMQRQTGTSSGDQLTFWTVCPHCYVRYQFYRNVINKLLCCQSCKKNFPGYEMPNPPMGGSGSGSQASNGKPVPNKGARKTFGTPSRTREPVFKTCTSQVDKEFVVGKDRGNPGVKVKSEGDIKASKPAGKVYGKGKRKIAECSSSSSDPDDDIAVDENGDILAKKNFGVYGDSPRRSARSKPPVSYDDKNGGNDDTESPLKKAKCTESVHVSEDPMSKDEKPDVGKSDSLRQNGSVSEDGILPNGKVESEHKNVESPNSDAATEPEVFEYPDPDFNDFDKGRREECFVSGQIWAVYDTIDAMPRFYARIRKVYPSGFKVRITWLEPDPDDSDETKWVSEGLPISCGRFKNGSSETTQDHLMFSHLMLWEKGSKKDSCNIRPLKGETWALFRNWDIKWYIDSNSNKKYEFEFVEILSEYSEADGVSVGYLGKVKGFSCLFCRIGKGGKESLQIPSNEMLRFSHRVPSFRMSGDERKDVPRDSFEFDPASFPADLEEVVAEEHLNVKVNVKVEDTPGSDKSPASEDTEVDPSDQNPIDEDQNPVGDSFDVPDPEFSDFDPAVGDSLDVPDPEFYDFDKDKAPDKFQIDQIWALYSDEDGLPKYYAQIKEIDYEPEFKLHISWLIPRQLPKKTIKWVEKKMVVSCGYFKSQKGVSEEYTGTDAFSHEIKVQCTDKKEYLIYPNEGQVWALYKNWHPGIKSSELETWDHDIVEIVGENGDEIKVLFLDPVDGFKSVFKAQIKDGAARTMEIDRKEILRFSHHIPAYKLTDEKGGSLRGFWELDPAALPVALFCTGS